ncbi:MCE family protein [Rhodococcus opacus]|uniref:MCE family protein n=1 Tax=Rhodococcus opacus TaxID=37919 RepID=UPI00031DEBC7|nr:MlaD family protein [Rhodococcus opacus]AHK36147.1 hypothetical protein Pd630_LPD16188 [Rhodococcus opacus PD630]UDH01237.1 MCE family protein [Rhodococcus opacus PD630]
MLLSKLVRYQLLTFTVVTLVSIAVIAVQYMKLHAMAGIGRNTIELVLPSGAGLYAKSNVSYRGVDIGVVDSLRIDSGSAIAVLSVDSTERIPADLDVEVHSRSAIGEQYVELLPRTGAGPYLADGDTITEDRTTIPTSTNTLVNTLSAGLTDIPSEDLRTLIDESGTAFTDTGADLQRTIDSVSVFIGTAQENLEPTRALIDNAEPLLDTQVQTADAIRGWSAYLASITGSLADRDGALRGLLDKGGPAAAELARLNTDVTPTLPRALGNLNSIADVLAIYHLSVEQLLVVYPRMAAAAQSVVLGAPEGMGNLDFNLDVNAPPPCTTGFLPADQRRSAADSALVESTEQLYCAVPHDDPTVVRGARNYPCAVNPDRRAPSVESCRSAEGYVPRGANAPFEPGGN